MPSLLEIIKYPDPILRKKSEEVKEITEEIKNLGFDMVETMTANQGVGLAAPQVGESKRIIIVQPIENYFLEEIAKKNPRTFINPKITRKGKETIIDDEGCLSFPGLFLKIKRAMEVEAEALNENGEKVYLKVHGLPARILQHEIDHLDGILFIDRLSFWQRLKIRKKLKTSTQRSKASLH